MTFINYPDTIKINKIKMEVYDEDEDKQQNIMIHELGHALGLKHPYKKNIMYKYITKRIDLGWRDRQCYNYNWK